MWSGQGPDEQPWYLTWRFLRWGPLFGIIALCGGLMIMDQRAFIPGSEVEYTGWRAVLIGLLFLFVGGGALGLLIASLKREQ